MAKKKISKSKNVNSLKINEQKNVLPGNSETKKIPFDLDKIIELIIGGQTYREIAKEFNQALSTLHLFLSKPEHSARVREALEYSASTYADQGEEVLKNAPGRYNELMRARELAQHYRWKASKRAPKIYGDKQEVEMTVREQPLFPDVSENNSDK